MMHILTSLTIILLLVATGARNACFAQALTVIARFSDETSISKDEPIELTLSRQTHSTEGRIVIFLDDIDVTSLFRQKNGTLIYQHSMLPLPLGAKELFVYLMRLDDSWQEIGRFSLRIEEKPFAQQSRVTQEGNPSSKWSAQWQPSLTLNFTHQSTVAYVPESNRPERYRFTDLSMQAGARTIFAHGSFSMQNQFDILGFSFRPQSLRFGELGKDAPLIDLPSYLIQLKIGAVNLQVGHSLFGRHRYLINSFSSRGLNLAFSLGRRADFSFSAMNGTSIVGWDNFFGLNRRKHQIYGGILGFELLPSRPGGLRLELQAVNGSLLPLSNYTQAHLNDAETSTGYGGRLLASDTPQRFHLEAGFARSRFKNPADALLAQGHSIVEARSHTANAHYVDASYQLLRDREIRPDWKAGLTVSSRYSRVDPLYRSVTAYAQADRYELQYELLGNIGEIALIAGMNQADDNLADIPSILKTRTRRANGQISVPLSAVACSRPACSRLLPRLAYMYDRTHQYGVYQPANGDFNQTAVPDQISANQLFSAEWQQADWRFGYHFNQSFQDNRQPGRERSDLINQIHNFTAGIKPHTILDLSFDLSSERSHNSESGARFQIWRSTTTLNLQPMPRSTLMISLGTTFQGDLPSTNKSRNIDIDAQWSTSLQMEKDRYRKYDAQIYIRYARRYARSLDNLFLLDKLTELQTVNAGLRITLF